MINPKTQRRCHLCGSFYTDGEGHNYNECAGILAQRRIEIAREARDIEQKYQEANKRAQTNK